MSLLENEVHLNLLEIIMAQQANNFNFDSYNAIMKTANTGLKLHLGVQLIKDVLGALEHFDNPLEVELRPTYVDLKEFQRLYKEAGKKAAEARTNDAEAAKAGGRTENAALLEALAAMQAQIAELKKAA